MNLVQNGVWESDVWSKCIRTVQQLISLGVISVPCLGTDTEREQAKNALEGLDIQFGKRCVLLSIHFPGR